MNMTNVSPTPTTRNTVPKSLTRMGEEWNGFPLRFIIMVFAVGIISLILIAGTVIASTMAGKLMFMLFMFGTWLIFFKFLRTPAIMNRSWLMYLYTLRALRGQTVTAKFKLPDGFLEGIIPLKKFHREGLIEFVGDKYGLLMRIDPQRISDDEVEGHLEKVKSMIDSLHGDLMLKLFVCSIPQSSIKNLERNVISTINKEDRTAQQKAHLYSIYHEAHDNTSSVIQWRFYLFISLGVYKDLHHALIAKQQYFPGLEARLHKCGVRVSQLVDKQMLAAAYRQCITQQGYI